jgi:hypothetical protein
MPFAVTGNAVVSYTTLSLSPLLQSKKSGTLSVAPPYPRGPLIHHKVSCPVVPGLSSAAAYRMRRGDCPIFRPFKRYNMRLFVPVDRRPFGQSGSTRETISGEFQTDLLFLNFALRKKLFSEGLFFPTNREKALKEIRREHYFSY